MTARERLFAGLKGSAPNKCWEWQKARQKDGYGTIRVGKKSMLTHRLMYELCNSSIPAGLVVRHICDNPPCCNPAHLVLGTDADNKRDSMAKGRHRWPVKLGERHPAAVLTAEQVQAIRADTRSQRVIAADYEISQPHVSDIKTRRKWSHI